MSNAEMPSTLNTTLFTQDTEPVFATVSVSVLPVAPGCSLIRQHGWLSLPGAASPYQSIIKGTVRAQPPNSQLHWR